MKKQLSTLAIAGSLLAISGTAHATTQYQTDVADLRAGIASITSSDPEYQLYTEVGSIMSTVGITWSMLIDAMAQCESSWPSGSSPSDLWSGWGGWNSSLWSQLDSWGTCLYSHLGKGSYAVTAVPQMRAQTQATVIQVSTRIANILRPSFVSKKTASLKSQAMGLSSGDPAANKIGVWGNLRHISSANKDDTSKYDGNNNSWLMAGDIRPMQNLLLGMTVSQDYARYKLINTKRESTATSVTPYVGYLFNDNFSVDALIGHSWLNNTENKVDSATFPDANRWFGSLSANGYLPLATEWLLSGKLGYMYSREKPEDLDALKLGQVSAGAEISYLHPVVEPYLGVTYTYDSTTPKFSTALLTTSTDRDDFRFTGGTRFYISDAFKGDIAVESVQGRTKYSETSVTANLRYEF